MHVELHPDVPGRGAWTRTGGLLPLKYGGTTGPGYYRAALPGELMVGAVSAFGADTGHTARVVHLGVVALQRLVNADPDGWLGNDTGAAIVRAQRRYGLSEDGVAGPKTFRALLEPLIAAKAAEFGVPLPVLGGIAVFESGLDPAAVGVNGWDHGLMQINLNAHDIRLEDALDPRFSLAWAAKDLRAVHDRWAGKTDVDPWTIAIANHNSPKAASDWAKTGHPPREQIETYVRKVRASW